MSDNAELKGLELVETLPTPPLGRQGPPGGAELIHQMGNGGGRGKGRGGSRRGRGGRGSAKGAMAPASMAAQMEKANAKMGEVGDMYASLGI